MYLDYSKLAFDKDGNPETPVLVLKTMGEDVIGPIPGAYNLTLNIKFAEPSEISFDVPAVIDGERNWIYDRLTGHKIVYTDTYGVYLVMNPSEESDGVRDVKHIQGYSIERELDAKKFFLEEGTFRFYDPEDQTSPDTILGRMLEVAPGWGAGYVSPSVAQRYRTFQEYDDYLLSFAYDTAPEKFRCVFVFDPYKRTINVYDADQENDTLPIYLDFDNLVSQLEVEEVSDELVTAMQPYGSDGLDIRDVNPIGTNWIYDLSHFVSNGDLPKVLADKWTAWQKAIASTQERYAALCAMRASATARLLSQKAQLTDLNGELETLIAQQSVTIQAYSLEITEAGRQYQQQLLDEINAKIAAKREEIAACEAEIKATENSLDEEVAGSYPAQIRAIVDALSIDGYFTADEYKTLSRYFIEQDMTEGTFVATTVDTSVSGTSYSVDGAAVSVTGAAIVRVSLDEFGKSVYTIAGGSFQVSGTPAIKGDVIRGTLEAATDGTFLMSLYGGSLVSGDTKAGAGMVTLSGSLSGLADDVRAVTVDEVTTYEGTQCSFSVTSGSLYLTADVSDYQKYSVQMELYDYAAEVLHDMAIPTYEFSVDSGNFIFSSVFAPFRNRLELGKGVYLNLGNGEVITPYIIEFEIDFEDREDFSLVFSNRFKRHDNCNTLKDMIDQGYSSGRSFDASKYIYNQTVGQASAVSDFMAGTLDAAKNTILAASNESVVINGNGIQIGGDSPYQMRIVNGMIAMTDDSWGHAKLAIGRFASEETGVQYGVNAELIAGKLIIGNNMILENTTDDGTMQFRVDASGAWLNNATFVLQKENEGRMILDPSYGLLAGTNLLFDTDGTTILPSFIDGDGDLILDEDGIPENANFFLDIRDGSAYFRGAVKATSGSIGGWKLGDDFLYSGSGSTYVALNASGETNSLYAIWAGAESPENANFWVKRDGSIMARNGTFMGVLDAARVSGVLKAMDGSSWIEGCGIRVGQNPSALGGYNFYVDPYGNVNIQGNLTLSEGSISWGSLGSSVTDKIDAAQNTANSAIGYASSAEIIARQIAEGEYANGSFINRKEIYGPTIYSNSLRVIPETVGTMSGNYSLYGYSGSSLLEVLRIEYIAQSPEPIVYFSSPASGSASFDFMISRFFGRVEFIDSSYVDFRRTSTDFQAANVAFQNATVNFTGANIIGLSTTATFG